MRHVPDSPADSPLEEIQRRETGRLPVRRWPVPPWAAQSIFQVANLVSLVCAAILLFALGVIFGLGIAATGFLTILAEVLRGADCDAECLDLLARLWMEARSSGMIK